MFCSGDRHCNCAPSASHRVWRFLRVLFHRLQRVVTGAGDGVNEQSISPAQRPLPAVAGGDGDGGRGVDQNVAAGDAIEQALIRPAGP